MSTFYGADTACLADVGLVDTLATDPKRLIGERLHRRLTTPRGALALIGDDPDFGWDVRQLVNGKVGPNSYSIAQSQIQAECQKDEQVSSAAVKVTPGQGGAVVISIQVVTSTGPFALTLNVASLTVDAVFSFQAAA